MGGRPCMNTLLRLLTPRGVDTNTAPFPEHRIVIDCAEPVAAKLFDLEDLKAFFVQSLGERKSNRIAKPEEPPSPPPTVVKPRIQRCGAQTPRSVGGLYTPRSYASTPRHPATSSAATPRRPGSAKPKPKKEKEVVESWQFKVNGKQILVGIPSSLRSGQSLLESMLRRYLQRAALLGRLELQRSKGGGITLRVDSKAAHRALDELQNAEDEGVWAVDIGWAATEAEASKSRRAPASVHPLQFDQLASLEEKPQKSPSQFEIEATTIQIRPKPSWGEKVPPPPPPLRYQVPQMGTETDSWSLPNVLPNK